MNVYIRKYWEEDDILFYMHFKDGVAVRQIEICGGETFLLSEANPAEGDHFLCDQQLDALDVEDKDFISREVFEAAWNG